MSRRSILTGSQHATSRMGRRDVAAAMALPGNLRHARPFRAEEDDPKKNVVNAWLSSEIGSLNRISDGWALLLESQILRTVNAIRKFIPPSRCIVCNPDHDVCEAIASSCADITVERRTSHSFLSGCSTSFNHRFSFIFLDYCGTLLSTSGRERQRDLLHILSDDGSMLHENGAILAVTVSQRGAPALYAGEVVDSTILFVQELAKSQLKCRSLDVAGVAEYHRGGRNAIMTIAFRVGTAAPSQCRAVSPPLSEDMRAGAQTVGVRLSDGWQLAAIRLQSDDEISPASTRPLYHALRDVARHFSSLVCRSVESMKHDSASSTLTAIVLEGKLLCVAQELCRAVGLQVRVVVADPLNAALSRAILDNVPAANNGIELLGASFGGLLRHEGPSLARANAAIFLSYADSKPFTASQLQQCAEWRDLSDVLRLGLLCRKRGVLGIMLGCASTCEMWENAAIDWIVCGVKRCGARHAYTFKVERVVRFSSRHDWLALSFCVVGEKVGECDREHCVSAQTSLSTKRKLPAHWKVFSGWDLDRIKAVPWSAKKRRSANSTPISAPSLFHPTIHLVSRAAHCWTLCVIFEPGFLDVCGALLSSGVQIFGALPKVEHDGVNDVLRRELTRRGIAILDEESRSEVLRRADGLLILDDCGVAVWRRRWSWLLTQWLDLRDSGDLILASEVAKCLGEENALETMASSVVLVEQCAVHSRGRLLNVKWCRRS